MKDSTRESLSYFGMYKELLKVRKEIAAEKVAFGPHKDQYFLYFEPTKVISDKVVVWIHGGGWNAGDPNFFYYVGQRIAKSGYRCISLGYRLSPKFKYPTQIEDVCKGYNEAVKFLKDKEIDTSRVIVCGPSAGAHLSSILCYSKEAQEKYHADVSNVIGYVGWGGPYSFSVPQSLTVKMLTSQLFTKGYDRTLGEPVSLMTESHIPMLLIQSRHDGVVDFAAAEEFAEKARELGIICELYEVSDKLDTHSWYTAGVFLKTREESRDLDRFYSFIESL